MTLQNDLITSPTSAHLTRRRFLAGLGSAVAGATFLAACGGDGKSDATSTPVGTAASAFPRSVVHKHGTAQVPAAPKRVVTLGFTDQDYALAFGVVPVAIREWFGAKPSATWPWAQPLLGGAKPEVLPRQGLDFELIAKMQPDLILAVYLRITPEEYARLSQIAPTIAGPAGKDDYVLSWQEQTRMTGDALGQPEKANKLITDLEAKVKSAAAANPKFKGATFTWVSVPSPSEHFIYGPKAAGATFLQELGLRMPDEVLKVTAERNTTPLSQERVDLVNADIVFFSEGQDTPGAQAILRNPLFLSLPVHKEGRDIFLGSAVYGGAFSFASILSLDLLVKDLVPAMARALDGDPATAVGLPS